MSDAHRVPAAAAIFVILGAALVPLYPYVFAIRPQAMERQRTVETELFELDKRVEQAKSAQRKYAQFREEASRLDVERVKLDLLMPSDDLLGRQVETAAAKNDIQLLGIEPLKPVDREFYVERAHDVALRGSIESIDAFLQRFYMPSPLATIARIELHREGEVWRATPRLMSFGFTGR